MGGAMFGFGMSAKDRWILDQTELMLVPLSAASGQPAKPLAKRIFDEAKADAVSRYGENAYSESNGDRLVQNETLLAKRTAAGLTVDDVRSYWNTPVLLSMIQLKVLELTDFVLINAAEQAGTDIVAFARARRKVEPRYGDPEKWNAGLPANQGFSMDDADIYPEFQVRVGKWLAAIPEAKKASLLSQYTSFNAMVRGLVSQRAL
jgi:hypothetical protein